MSLFFSGSQGADKLHPVDGWGEVPVTDRKLWSRYMVDHLPWFPGVTVMVHIAPGVMGGNTRAPQIWKDAARALHAVGFTPADYYLLAELIKSRIETLDVNRHAQLFEVWPTGGERGPRTFQLNPELWVSWLDQVRAGGSPRRALDWVLSDGNLSPMGGLYTQDGEATTIVW